jgi:hypothetical protein
VTSPHFLMELHVPACAVSNGSHAEHIPQLGAITRTGPVIMDGWVRPADEPDIGTDGDLDPADDLRVD